MVRVHGIKSIGSEFAERMYYYGKKRRTTTMADGERGIVFILNDVMMM